MQCGAKKRDGGSCPTPAMPNGKCRMHGGKSTGSGTLKHGRYSMYLPSQLGEHYNAALHDKDLLSLKGEAELVQAFILDAVQALDLDQCQAAWDTLSALAKDVHEASKSKDVDSERASIALEMANVIRDGVEVWKQVNNVLGYIEKKRALADTEAKRIKAAAETITAKEGGLLVRVLVEAIRKEFSDQPDRVARVAQQLTVVLGGRSNEPADRAA